MTRNNTKCTPINSNIHKILTHHDIYKIMTQLLSPSLDTLSPKYKKYLVPCLNQLHLLLVKVRNFATFRTRSTNRIYFPTNTTISFREVLSFPRMKKRLWRRKVESKVIYSVWLWGIATLLSHLLPGRRRLLTWRKSRLNSYTPRFYILNK